MNFTQRYSMTKNIAMQWQVNSSYIGTKEIFAEIKIVGSKSICIDSFISSLCLKKH